MALQNIWLLSTALHTSRHLFVDRWIYLFLRLHTILNFTHPAKKIVPVEATIFGLAPQSSLKTGEPRCLRICNWHCAQVPWPLIEENVQADYRIWPYYWFFSATLMTEVLLPIISSRIISARGPLDCQPLIFYVWVCPKWRFCIVAPSWTFMMICHGNGAPSLKETRMFISLSDIHLHLHYHHHHHHHHHQHLHIHIHFHLHLHLHHHRPHPHPPHHHQQPQTNMMQHTKRKPPAALC